MTMLEAEEPTVEVDGNIVKINSNSDMYLQVYVDGTLSAATREQEVELRLSNGEHDLGVSLTDRAGYEKIFSSTVRTFGASSLSLLNTVLLVLVGIYVVIRVVKWKTR